LKIEFGNWILKKINKSNSPNELTKYFDNHPNDSWENFRNFNEGDGYNAVKGLVFTDQGELCAYCEKNTRRHYPHEKRIEHYHSKSEKNHSGINWGLDWNNVIGVCLGGSDTKISHPLPENLSCDSHKGHFETKNKLPIPCDGYVLNPLDIIATPVLFDFDKSTGELAVNSAACAQYSPKHNNFTSVNELVENTIKVFNLNCNRLTEDRLKIFHFYLHQIKLARKKRDTKVHSRLATNWFSERWPSYFTTRRLILGKHAELYLISMKYDG